MTRADTAAELTGLLSLDFAPVAITFHRDVPNGATSFFDAPMTEPTEDGRTGRVPASCVFWVHGHETTFSTVVEDHGNCSVGQFTHGMVEAADILDKSDVGTLLEVGWVTLEAFGGVVSLDRAPSAVTYGPLAEADSTPDVVLLRLNPRQMMEIGDAIDVELSGKPQCQILAKAANDGVIAVSWGCALSRARTGMGDDELTCAVPGHRIDELVTSLRDVCRADEAVIGYAEADKARF